MLIPISWLKRYVPVDLPAKELAHRLTMAGLEIDAVREVGADWGRDKVVVGHVMAVDRHPNADRLTMPTLDLGGGETARWCVVDRISRWDRRSPSPTPGRCCTAPSQARRSL